jgi:CDP-glucose 4,6-dehydratase
MFNNFYKGKKVLVTGHTGFKGSWFCIWLTQLGASVYGYALPPIRKEDNFEACEVGNLINHQVGDVNDANALADYFLQVKPDIAFHFAAQSLVLESYTNTAYTFQTNLMGVVNFFEAVRKTPSVLAAINITSDKCYDNKEWIWGYRESDPMGGKDPYSASKGCSELITASYIHSFFSNRDSCKVASVRAGNVIGGGDWAENRIVPDFFRSYKNDDVLFIRHPNAVRPWQHVLEPLSGYLALGEKLFSDRHFSGGWNFGPDASNTHTVKYLIDNIINIAKRGNCEFSGEKAQLHEAHLLKLDISKATGLLAWKPALNFDETLEYTVKGYLDQIGGKNLIENRIEQIEQYARTAMGLKIPWANK